MHTLSHERSLRGHHPLDFGAILSLLFCLLVALWTPSARADFTLVADGVAPAPIFSVRQIDQAPAAELAAYLSKISGAKFAAAPAPATLPERCIIVGPVNGDTGATQADLEPDAFRIRVSDQRAILIGGSPRAVFYAVFDLLEKQGCKWWSADEEDIPKKPAISLASGDTVTRPAFSMHDLFNREAQQKLNHFDSKSRSTSTEEFLGGHSLYPLLKDASAAHNEFFPMDKKGKRAGNNLHFCYLAPGIAQALADALEKKIIERKGELKNTIYFAGMGDWYGGMCECEACNAMYKAELWTDPSGAKKPGYTATLLTMINQTAEILEKKYPGVRIGTFAYMSLEAPPATIVPRANVVIRVPRLRHCTVHSAESCANNASFVRNLKRWCEIAPKRVYVWEYGANFAGFLRPFPCLYSMANNLEFYSRIGIKGVEIQGNYTSTGGDLAVMKNYVWRKVFADPKTDPKAALVEFCKGYYGAAADDMLAYVDTLERSVLEPAPVHANEFAATAYLTPEVNQKLAGARDKALEAVKGNETLERRVREATISLTINRIWKPGPLEEQDDKLIRKDLGRYTYDEALQSIKWLRGSGVTEWSSGRAQQSAMLVMQGGPLPTLSAGRVKVKVAPVMNGHIRQILFDDKPLLADEVALPNGKGKMVKGPGGSVEVLNTRVMEMVGNPTPTKVTMQGDGGVGLFGGLASETILKTVEMTADGAIITRATHRAVRGNNETKSATIRTAYRTGKDIAGLRVEYLASDNQWKAIEFSKEKPEAGIPRTTAIRITIPDKGCVVVDRILAPARAHAAAAAGDVKEDSGMGVAKGSLEEQAIPLNPETDADDVAATTMPRSVGSVTLDAEARTLLISIRGPASPGGTKTDELFLERKIEVTPIAK